MCMSDIAPLDRPVVSGKFLQVNGQRYLIKGVSYGTFAPDADGDLFPALPRVAQDFDAIAELEANTVRTYTRAACGRAGRGVALRLARDHRRAVDAARGVSRSPCGRA